MTVYEIHARQRKVTAMVSLLRETNNQPTADDLARLDDKGWSVLAQLVGSHPPSEKTKQMVIREMEKVQ